MTATHPFSHAQIILNTVFFSVDLIQTESQNAPSFADISIIKI